MREEELSSILKGENDFLHKIVESQQLLILVWDTSKKIVWFNKYSKEKINLSYNRLKNGEININTIIPENTVNRIMRNLLTNNESTQCRYGAYINGDTENEQLYILWRNNLIIDEKKNKFIVSTGVDLTNIKRTELKLISTNNKLLEAKQQLSTVNKSIRQREEMLLKNQERYRLVVEGTSDGLWDWDIKNDRVYISENWRILFGFKDQEINDYKEKWIKLIHLDDVDRVRYELNKSFNNADEIYSCEYRVKEKDNSYIWIVSKGKIIRDKNANPVRMAGSYTNISKRKRNEMKLKHLAYYDQLTDLTIRNMFMEQLNFNIICAKRDNIKLALLFIDIDNFKLINDTFGHDIGDIILKRIARIFVSSLRDSDAVSRVGGDEFVALLNSIDNIKDIEIVVKRILQRLTEPIIIEAYKIYVTASIGISVYPYHGNDGDVLLKHADLAMYKAKKNGKNNYEFYDGDTKNEYSDNEDTKKNIKTALKENQFFICFQPIYDINKNKVSGMEALLRWKHPTKGIILPSDFIDIAETTKLIIPIGEWVLRESCKKAKEWCDRGYRNFKISVNVSAIQLQQANFIETLNEIILETKLDTQYLQLEITENHIIKSNTKIIGILEKIKSKGINIIIDDFGTGYSSLSYLQRFKVDALKIDRTFICNYKNDVNRTIIKTIISLGHKIGIAVVAEGIETEEQLKFLKECGCDKVQGFYFSKPVSDTKIIEFMN